MPTNILMPALSPTMEEGILARWLVREGDNVKSGDVLAEIETDKATMEFEAVDEGTIAKLLIAEGTEGVKVNTPIAVLIEEGEDADAVPAASPAAVPEPAKPLEAAAAPAPAPEPPQTPEPAVAAPRAAPAGDRLRASPLARRLAAEAGLELADIAGSGPAGRIVKADVEAARAAPRGAAKPAPTAATSPATAPAPSALPDARLFFADGTYTEVPHDSMRRTIARRLTVAKRDIPHFYLTVDCRLDALLAARAQLNARSPKEGPGAYKLSVNDFVVKAAATALMRVPGVNASWTEDALLRHAHADIGVAVALDFGLITPIVTAAETKGLVRISQDIRDLAVRARAKKLKPQEFEGGSFAISNLGMFGIRNFTAVINPPHAAILAVGAGEDRVIAENGAMQIATMMTVCLSCDHRVIDGALGAEWLGVFKGCIENPVEMLA